MLDTAAPTAAPPGSESGLCPVRADARPFRAPRQMRARFGGLHRAARAGRGGQQIANLDRRVPGVHLAKDTADQRDRLTRRFSFRLPSTNAGRVSARAGDDPGHAPIVGRSHGRSALPEVDHEHRAGFDGTWSFPCATSNSSAQSAPENSMCPVTTTLPLKNPAVLFPRCSA